MEQAHATESMQHALSLLPWIEREFVGGGKPINFRKVLKAFSVSCSFDVAAMEWVSCNSTARSTHCICSQRIDQCFPIYNQFTGHTLVVGSECINKLPNASVVYAAPRSQTCLSCGMQHPYVTLLCVECLSQGRTEVNTQVMERLGVRDCTGGLCGGRFIYQARYGKEYKCNKCTSPTLPNICESCGIPTTAGPTTAGPRCWVCYRCQFPVKCKTPECWNMVKFLEGDNTGICYTCASHTGLTWACNNQRCDTKAVTPHLNREYAYCSRACKHHSFGFLGCSHPSCRRTL